MILLNAPKQPVTINGGISMNSWYDIISLNPTKVDDTSIARSTTRIIKVLDAETNLVDPSRVYIGGFS